MATPLVSFFFPFCVTTTLFAQDAMKTKSAVDIDIAFTKFVLPNGLTLIVHEDHKAPIVAVNVWYHVGSKNERPGKSGFAHLFEHLMFNGSENFDDDYFQAMERIGATDMNGTTSEDRTNYFQNVPTSALDVALWMESDRMGHLVGAISQKKLDEQRGVVQNEKRQGENEPYAVTEELIAHATYPAGHPYSWTVIGSMEDLNAASLSDVKDWFKAYYGAANAVLAVAGDIDAQTALAKVTKYFGDIPAGPPIARNEAWVAKMSGTHRARVEDRVPQSRLYKVWNVPQRGTADAEYLRLVGSVLSDGKSSRLYKRLVYDDQIATDVSAYLDAREIGGQFYVVATAKPGGDLQAVGRAVDEEISKFLETGPTAQELERARTQFEAGFVRGSERIGGFGGKSDILASSFVFGGTPDAYKRTLHTIHEATPRQLLSAAKEWLSDGVYELEVYPYPDYSTSPGDTVLRKELPKPGNPPEARFPAVSRATLTNGMKVMLVERTSVPVVTMNILFDAGFAADQSALPGTANLAMQMLDEGTKTRTSIHISDELASLGAQLNAGSNLDMSTVSMTALTSNLDASIDLLADILLHPSFPQQDFERLQKLTLADIQQEKVSPVQMALRVFPALLYGGGHAYGNPLTGSGTEESVKKLTREDLAKFHDTWLRPNNATMIVVGATTMAEIRPKLEKFFSAWKPGDVPKKNIGTVEISPRARVYIVDKPGALQSIIFAGHVSLPKNNPQEVSIEAMNNILGGLFTSRINMNLREDKHWAYGAFSFLWSARGQRPFIGYAPVQTDKTKESMVELSKELRDILDKKPVTDDELLKVQNSMTLELPGSWETNSAVAHSIANIVRFGLPEDYYDTYAHRVRALTKDDVEGAARTVVHPDQLTWVVVGDRSKIEPGIRELGYGDIKFIDSDGNAAQ